MAALTLIEYPEEPTTEFDISGEAEAVAASASGDTFRNSGTVGFWVSNASGSPRTLTFDAPKYCNHGFQHDAAIVVADAFEGFVRIGFEPSRFNDGSNDVTVTYSSEAGLTVAAVLFPA